MGLGCSSLSLSKQKCTKPNPIATKSPNAPQNPAETPLKRDIKFNLVLISTNRIFEDNKIAKARGL